MRDQKHVFSSQGLSCDASLYLPEAEKPPVVILAHGFAAERQFGTGSTEGLTAAETGNSAVIPGALIPALTLAVPGSAPAAVLIAALFIHGIRPGPMIMFEQPDFIYSVAAMLTFATLAIDPAGQCRRDKAIIPFSTSVYGNFASSGGVPIAIVRVISVVPSRYCPPESIR